MPAPAGGAQPVGATLPLPFRELEGVLGGGGGSALTAAPALEPSVRVTVKQVFRLRASPAEPTPGDRPRVPLPLGDAEPAACPLGTGSEAPALGPNDTPPFSGL